MSVVDRIYQVVDAKGISVNEFSKRIGVSNGYLAKQRSSKNGNVGVDVLIKIVDAFPDVDMYWLILGDDHKNKLKEIVLNRTNIDHISPSEIDDHLSQFETVNKDTYVSPSEIERVYCGFIEKKDVEIKELQAEINRLNRENGALQAEIKFLRTEKISLASQE